MPNKTWHTKASIIKYGYCTHPQSTKVDNVTGEITYKEAQYMRQASYNKDEILCGPTGQFYVEENDSFTKFKRELNNEWFGLGLFCFVSYLVFKSK
jgi:hypothetical protein